MGEFDGEGVGDTLGACLGGRIGEEVVMISDKINEAESSLLSSGANHHPNIVQLASPNICQTNNYNYNNMASSRCPLRSAKAQLARHLSADSLLYFEERSERDRLSPCVFDAIDQVCSDRGVHTMLLQRTSP